MSLVVVDSGGANISSILHSVRRLGMEPVFSSDAAAIGRAQKVILPGVGAAGRAMDRLRRLGLVDVLRSLRQPVLGICLGMQLLFESSEEDQASLLGLIPARLTRLPRSAENRVPHMGWNRLACLRPDALGDPLDGQWFYFVHSYAAPLGEWTLASCTHGRDFSAFVRRGNFYGAQFHPERSAAAGSRLLQAFLGLN